MLLSDSVCPLDHLFLYVYYIMYSLTVFNVFIIILKLNFSNFRTFSDLRFIVTSPLYSTSLSICLLTMAGVPPMAGFFTKLFMLKMLLHAGPVAFFFFFFLIIYISLFFYIQNFRFMKVPEVFADNSIFHGTFFPSIWCNSVLIFGNFIFCMFWAYLEDAGYIITYYVW